MLLRFNATNFLSFKEETEFNMLAAKSLKTHTEHLYPVKKGINVLKTSAIYGANGAGKSNLIKAISILQNMVKDGHIPVSIDSMKYRFDPAMKDEPIALEIEFSFNAEIYAYGVKFDEFLVLEEWLYLTGSKHPEMIFTRKHTQEKLTDIQMASRYLQTEKSRMLISLMEENLLMPDELLLSKHSLLKISEIENAHLWMIEMLLVVFPESAFNLPMSLYSNDEKSNMAVQLMQSFNVGIDGIEFIKKPFDQLTQESGIDITTIDEIKKTLDKTPDTAVFFSSDMMVVKENTSYSYIKLRTRHKESLFDMAEESDGTQRLLEFIPMLQTLVREKVTYIVDEIDRSLHPSILHSLIRKIMADNTTKGQLIFTTHESSLLDCSIFRADEIWFAEKKENATQLYTLNEFKPHPDLDIEKGYLNGRFGAIPFLSQLDELNWN